MVYLSTLEKNGYEGTDMDLDTSLSEYGLAWKEYKRNTKSMKKGDLHVYSGEEYNGSRFIGFGDAVISRNDLLELDWVKWEEVASMVGVTIDELKRQPTGQLLSDLIIYHGSVEFGFDGNQRIGGLTDDF